MSGYVTVNRLSLIQLHCEERKQRAHLNKIAEMQRRSGLDMSPPAHFPRVRNYTNQVQEKRREIVKANDIKSRKILDIMQSKTVHPSPAFYPTNSNRRRYQPLNVSQNSTDYLGRIAKTKGIYDVREWDKEFQEHQEHLKISRDNKLFTPRDIGRNRLQIRAASLPNSKRTTPSASVVSMSQQPDKNN